MQDQRQPQQGYSIWRRLKGLALLLGIGAMSACAAIGAPHSEAPVQRAEFDDRIVAPRRVLRPPVSELSEWHFESLALCLMEDGAQLSDFVLPRRVDLWDRIAEGFTFEPVERPAVAKQVEWIRSHPLYLKQISRRAAPYLHHIVEVLAERNLPMELALLPMVESAFDPFAYSRVRAAGMWQVVPGTGEALGLKQNWWYDGRRDVIASTDAALTYLDQLQRRFDGDWLLALAAYNSGQGTVARARLRNIAAGKPTDFWSLELPRETRAYIPKLLAIRTLIEGRALYAPSLAEIPDAPYFALVDIGSQINLGQAATLAGLEPEELHALNPGFNRWATDPDGPHVLLLPTAKAEAFERRLAGLAEDERAVWERYAIQNGDTLSELASRFKTSVAALQQANQLKGARIRRGQILLVPRGHDGYAGASRALPARSVQAEPTLPARAPELYSVRAGDSLWSIARQRGVGIAQLRAWNAYTKTRAIRPGDTLALWPSADALEIKSQKFAYRVREGDNLTAIAQRFKVAVSDIVQWNRVNPSQYLKPGQSLTLFVADADS